jgi:hypothetical protein
MAKSKAKGKAKGKKDTAGPKKAGGVKVPKSLSTLLNSGLGREILADALIAAAGAAASALTRTRTAKNAGQALSEGGAAAAGATGDAVQTAAGAVAEVLGEAARSFLPPSLVGEDKPEAERGTVRPLNRSPDLASRKRPKGGRKDEA